MSTSLSEEQKRREPGYPEAVAITGGLWLGLLLVQAALTPKLSTLQAPAAATIAFLPLLFLILVGYFAKNHPVVRFLSGIPFAITSVACTSLGALIGTLVLQNPSPQDAKKLGSALPLLQKFAFTDVYHSLWFGGLILTLMVCLGLCAGRRLRPLNFKNLVFLFTHLGTALVLAGGIFSNFTALSGMIALEIGQPSALLQAEDGSALHLPGPLLLKDFAVDPFPLEVTLGVADDRSAALKRGGRSLPYLEPGRTFHVQGWAIECLEALPQAELESKVVEDPAGKPAIELILRSHGTESRVPLTASSGIISMPGGILTGMMEVPEGAMEHALMQARTNWGQEGQPGVLYVTDGGALVAISRDFQGRMLETSGAKAMEPVSFGRLSLAVGKHYRGRIENRYKTAVGLRQEPLGAARLRAVKGSETREGWIAAGPGGAEWLKLEGENVLMLLAPQPKTFRSEIQVEGRLETIRVNHPLEFQGWQITQTSWQVDGSGRPISVLRAMKDPSIPVVWAAMSLLMLGTMGALWSLPGILNVLPEKTAKEYNKEDGEVSQ